MPNPNGNRKPKAESAAHKKLRHAFLLDQLTKLSVCFGVELTEARAQEYFEELERFHPQAIALAVQRTKREWGEASKFPPLRFILDRIDLGKPAEIWDWNALESLKAKRFEDAGDVEKLRKEFADLLKTAGLRSM